ncbi:polysaccharide deacetylase family protein [Sulfurospirillum sp. 1307]|jgi:peptidoglycan/xylan/chitin deacetylase (PgdA/CDA1 family)
MKSFLLLLISALTLWANAHIFVYHRFGDSRYPSTNTTIKELKKQFEYFKNNGYKVVSLDTLVNKLNKKEKIPDNWVVLTIDDNFKSFYQNGLKIFKDYNYPFSLFVYVEATQKGYHDYLSWDELKEISKYGSLEFHSYSHGHMNKMSNEEIKKDFDKGLDLFQKHLSIKPKYFTYPYGEYTSRVKEFVKSYGFKAIINQNMGAIDSFSDIYDLDRTALVGKSNLANYLKYKALKAKWIEPKAYPKDGVLKSLHVNTNEDKKNATYYISGKGWLKTKLNNGEVNLVLNEKLTKKRTRLILGVGDKISTKLLIKDKYGTK